MVKRYKVIGPHAVLGNQPGEEFDEQLDPGQEKRLLARGSIEEVIQTRSTRSMATATEASDTTRGSMFGRRNKEDENA